MHQTHEARRDALRARLVEHELDAMLVTDLRNIRYLTGFTGSNAALLVHSAEDKRSVFCTDGRYEQQAAAEVGQLEQVIERQCGSALTRRAAADRERFRRLGFESQHVSVDTYDALLEQAEGVELRRAPGLVERLRMVKDESEIEAIRMACAAADRALAEVIEQGEVRAGMTERQIARELESRMMDNGAAGPAFETIVAAGAHSAIPHHRPTDAELCTGDLVKIDFGALVDGYHSDMTRMLVVGPPADWQRELYQLVRTAQAAGCQAALGGAELAAVDRAAREVIERAGYGERFLHGLGHGVGLDVHEAPRLAKEATGTLAAGMTVTVEPGVYLADRGGVRIEDTLAVREDGNEVLTLSTKELVTV
ncbi:Xaa-Pro peptidase family protein [Haloechinothrix sp. LS1_15]|uniref:M24 family metallopeptidase n=1 Tax=Haloechinothrix sp. LS1_15 TaxID=2652248 RepID=UPI0029480E59|nr:Xaa-Pro peptidase family protein [Haloechinothrix sp. LS1_15]MDV6013278.1 aminopeptidase P family protein [Haloechinothrix sp. LS1_15]